MNQLETELLKRRVLKPIENWDKVVKAVKSRAFSETRLSPATLVHRLVASLYDEVWREPEKIVFFRDNVVDLGVLFPRLRNAIETYRDAFKRKLSWLEPKHTNPIVTVDSVLSYITLREHGFRIGRRNRGVWHAVVVLLTTKVLSVDALLQLLSNDQLSRTGKLVLLNGLLNAVALPNLTGRKESELLRSAVMNSGKNEQQLVELVLGVKGNGHEPTRNRAVKATGT